MQPDLRRNLIAGLLSLAILLLPALQAGQRLPDPGAVKAHPLLLAFCGRSTQALQAQAQQLLQPADSAASGAKHCPQCFLHAVPPMPNVALVLAPPPMFVARAQYFQSHQALTPPAKARAPPSSLHFA